MSRYNYPFKILMIGNTSVGKSNLSGRFIKDVFNSRNIFALGIDFAVKTITIDGKLLTLQIWDPPHGEMFMDLLSPYYRGTHGFMIIYDISNRASFDNLEIWLSDIEQKASSQAQKLLVGNKVDLEDKKEVDYATGKALAEKWKIPFIETSAKDSTNVELAFVTLASQIKNQFGTETVSALGHGYPVTPIGKTKIENQGKGKGCQII